MKYILALVAAIVSSVAYSSSCWTSFLDEAVSREKGFSVIEFAVERSPIIFTGSASVIKKTIIEEDGESESILDVQVLFDVEESIKGDFSGKQLVSSGKVCSCKYDFKSGIKYLIFATERNGSLYLHNCGYISPLDISKVQEVRQAVSVNKARQ
ncbi:hypothetical protein ACJJID_05150 [Microbulbifer sp. CnH-101-G]|uniref:hypothetical protein n=1 Tax=Microbulbifer sp. CnH-101-G TaxID=3243393 RepID=UPI0040399037